jgi:flavin reductase (DIM6/NTAB) family NADH-FMN oxidoreductase RutF
MRITTYANPRQAILVSCRADRKDNIVALSWHTPLSFEPKMYAIAVGKTRYSCELLKKSKCFVVNFMSNDFEKEIYYCGSHSGRDIDKFKETGFKKEEAEKIDCPIIKAALGFFECKVIKEVEVGDHVLFIGDVVNEGLRREGKRLFHIHADKFTTTID